MRFASRTTLSLGAREQRARYDVVDLARPGASGERNHTLYAWDVSLRQALSPDASIYVRRGNSFRLPNVSDNYNQTLATVTLLEPQTAREWEAGLEGTRGSVHYRASVYSIRMRNEIFFDPVTLGSRNRQPTRHEAVELEAAWEAYPAVQVHANYVYAVAKFTEGVVRGISIAGNRVPLAPRHTLRVGLQWSPSSAWGADFDVRYVGSSAFDADEPGTFGREIPGYTVADLRLSWRGDGWLVNGGVRNLFDREYLSYGVFTGRPTYSAFPAPERTMFVSAQYTFE
jgi:iron complex outermembrane receptor protein